ncbi:TPA: M20/M25/M40 family metallo-hydrolase [bacterium]|nr:M20/M25/M40 family metallo-hydrolase [bacterium]
MTQSQNKIILIITLTLLFLITAFTFADEVLVKINIENYNKINSSILDKCNFRFQGKSFILIQGERDLFIDDIFSIIDTIQPNQLYYMIGQKQRRSELEQIGKVVLETTNSLLIRIKLNNQPKLITLGLPLSPLPENIKLDLDRRLAPFIDSDSAIDSAVIREVANAVNKDGLKKFVYDLQENNGYKSRYCLRVRETDDPSDEACDNAADYIYKKFESYGLKAEYDSFDHEVLTQGKYKMRNVIATLPGKGADSHKVFIISSHYDSIASKSTNWQLNWKTMPAPGADDNATATAAVLESARILSQYDFNSTIKFVAFSGEELGLHGSKHYASMLFNNNEEIAGVLNLDMIGYDPDIPDIDVITNLGSEWLAEAMISIQKKYNLGSLILKKIVNPDMVYSDHAPFWWNGYSAILSIDNSNFDSPEFNPFMHSEKDTIETLNFDMMTNMVQIAIATLASLADPVDEIPHPDLAIYESGIHLSNERPAINQTIELKAFIENIGNADAKDVSVEVWIKEPIARELRLIDKQKIDVIAQKQVKITTSLSLKEWGESQIIVKVNPDYNVFETDGRNNIAIRSIKIGSNLLSIGKLLIYPNPTKPDKENGFNFEYTLSRDSSVRLEIHNLIGELIYSKEYAKGLNGGKFGINKGIKWNGENISGAKVAPGLYVCNLIATEAGTTEVASGKIFLMR